MIVPIVLGSAVAAGVWHHHKKKGPQGMTPTRKAGFEALLKSSAQATTPQQKTDTAAKLNSMADVFSKNGLKAEGEELRKRAAILTATPETLRARAEAFKKTMQLTDANAVKKMADVFHKIGHYDAASKLRNYAKGLAGFHASAKVSL